jgi:hypothetical protein
MKSGPIWWPTASWRALQHGPRRPDPVDAQLDRVYCPF